MPTIATFVGMRPVLLPGVRSAQQSVAISVGMAIGTIFTLFVVPALYTLVASDRRARRSSPEQTQEWEAHRAST